MTVFLKETAVLPFSLFALWVYPISTAAQEPTAQQIIEQSVAANREDFKAAPLYRWKETSRNAKGSKTSQVEMISGTPYYRLIAVDGKPLRPSQEAQETKKREQVILSRGEESAAQRRKRIEKYDKERRGDEEMMAQLTKAFTFTLVGRKQLRGFEVWDLKATCRKDYKPTSMETQVLTGMQGELWIDTKSHQWVSVKAQVVRPVAIGGFLAKVQPGTEFDLEKAPVPGGVWLASHFGMKSDAKVVGMFSRTSQEDTTFFDYTRKGASSN